MGIAAFIESKSKQTAVYWGNPSNDGRGRYTFGVLVEVTVRWEDEIENFAKDSRSRIRIDKDGREYRPNATIYTSVLPTGGWDLDGFMYLGTLLSLGGNTDPYTIDGAFEIKQINTVTALNNVSEKLYQIHL
jgi:hypothetical protein